MKSKDEVMARFDGLRSRRLAQRRERFMSRHHLNCISNIRLRVKGHGKCGFCRNPNVLEKAKGGPFVCDEEGTATRCPFFECRNTPETVERDFNEILASTARCGNEYPKLAVLIWFLQGSEGRSRGSRLRIAIREAIRSCTRLVFWRWW